MIRLGHIPETEPFGRSPNGLELRRTLQPFHVYLFGFMALVIPAGFVSDGASIPWFLRWRYESWGRYTAAALIHDYLLTLDRYPKWFCDWMFMGALRVAGVPALETAMFWLAVRSKRPGRQLAIST